MRLVGDPHIDVWNHAWGYWFVLDALQNGQLPFSTDLVGAPDGGTLYFIDTPGALLALPVTALFGPAVAYNTILIGRIALAGFAAQGLATAVLGAGRGAWLAGVIYASTPFLLCELSNGISEVCATQWLAFTLWAAVLVVRRGHWRDYLLLGILQGITSVVTFYYGLTSAILVAVFVLGSLGLRVWRNQEEVRQIWASTWWKLLLTTASAVVLMLPHWIVFWRSLHAEDALITRSSELSAKLMRHNAVDPRIYVMPGDFQSVDLLLEYGEPFLHTGYLRWSVILLAAYGVLRVGRLLWPWVGLLFLSLVLGLGSYLWWGSDWLLIGEQSVSLPFHWILQLLPPVAITHPLRFSLGAQIIIAVLSVAGLRSIVEHCGDRVRRGVLVLIPVVVVGEGFWGSSAQWPIPSSNATIPEIYRQMSDDERSVLNLPAEVGTSMDTSYYFWLQTAHGRPIPYTPDVRLGSAKDEKTFQSFMKDTLNGEGVTETPGALNESTTLHMRDVYSVVVLHQELEERAGITPSYETVFTPEFGEPEAHDGVLVWSLPVLSTAAELSAISGARNQEISVNLTSEIESGGIGFDAVNCENVRPWFDALVSSADEDLSEQRAALYQCGDDFLDLCIRIINNSETSPEVVAEAVECVETLGSEQHKEKLPRWLERRN